MKIIEAFLSDKTNFAQAIAKIKLTYSHANKPWLKYQVHTIEGQARHVVLHLKPLGIGF